MLEKEQECTTHCIRTICSTHFKSIEIINTRKLAHVFLTEQITILRVILSIATDAIYSEGLLEKMYGETTCLVVALHWKK